MEKEKEGPYVTDISQTTQGTLLAYRYTMDAKQMTDNIGDGDGGEFGYDHDAYSSDDEEKKEGGKPKVKPLSASPTYVREHSSVSGCDWNAAWIQLREVCSLSLSHHTPYNTQHTTHN